MTFSRIFLGSSRRVLLTGRYAAEVGQVEADETTQLVEKVRAGELTASELVAHYSALLYRRHGTYTEVARRTGVDPRTTRKYVEDANPPRPGPGRPSPPDFSSPPSR